MKYRSRLKYILSLLLLGCFYWAGKLYLGREKNQENAPVVFEVSEEWIGMTGSGTDRYKVEVNRNAQQKSRLFISNLSNLGVQVLAFENHGIIRIDTQQLVIDRAKYNISGEGTYNEGKLSLNYWLTGDRVLFHSVCYGNRIK